MADILDYLKLVALPAIQKEYIDRIYGNVDGSSLRCKNCDKLIGSLTIYEKENRPADVIQLGTIKKKIVKLG